MSQPNPYVSSAHVPTPAKEYRAGTRKLDYGDMFGFAFSNTNWVVNLLMCSLCFLVAYVIPLLPQLVLSGYLWEQVERLHVQKGGPYADFDFNRLGDYLMRGLWPFLATLLLMLIMFMLLIPIGAIGFGGAMAMAANGNEEGGMAVGMITYLGILALTIPMQLVMLPVLLRVGLTQELGGAFSLSWVKDFLRRTWLEIILGSLVLTLASFLVMSLGLLVFCIGVLPAAAIIMYAFTHFQWQLYEIYIDRGGAPLQLKSQAVAVLPPKYV